MKYLLLIVAIVLWSPNSSAIALGGLGMHLFIADGKKGCKRGNVRDYQKLNIVFCHWGDYVIDKVWIEYYFHGALMHEEVLKRKLHKIEYLNISHNFEFMDKYGYLNFDSDDDNKHIKVVFKYRIVGTNIKKGKIKSCTANFDPSNTKVVWKIFGRGKTYEQNRCRKKSLSIYYLEGH